MSNPRPAVCICIPAYNASATLPATLDSVLAQTWRDLAVVVVDNASTDRTAEIADGYAARDPRVRVVRSQSNVGPEGNFNRCLELAHGDFTAIFHSDDVYAPSIVEEEVAFLRANPEAGCVFTMAEAIDEKGEPAPAYRLYGLPPELRGGGGRLYGFEEIFRTMLKRGNFLFCPSAMARTAVYRDHIVKWDSGGFRSSSDGDVWLRILSRYKIGIIEKPLLKYRISASSFSYHAARKKSGPHDMLKLFEWYMAGPAAGITGPAERSDFGLLRLRDAVNRAFNLLVTGDRAGARAVLLENFSPGLLPRAARCAYQFKVVLKAAALWGLAWLPLGKKARERLFRARFRGPGR